MNSIAFDVENEKRFSSRIQKFFRRYQISGILKKCNAYKEQGFSVVTLIQYLFCPVFRNRSMFLDMQSEKAPEFKKDTVYRLKNSTHIDWKRFTTLLASRIISDTIKPLTSENRRNAFIVDDSIYERKGSKKAELLAKVYDHASHRYTRGFRMLTLGWSDGVTFLPVNSCLLSSENENSRINEGWDVDSNSNGAKARKFATKKATEVIPELISDAMESGIHANYVLFDSWFSSPKAIRSMKELGLDGQKARTLLELSVQQLWPEDAGRMQNSGLYAEKEQQDPLLFSGADVFVQGYLPLLQAQTRPLPVSSECTGGDLRRGRRYRADCRETGFRAQPQQP